MTNEQISILVGEAACTNACIPDGMKLAVLINQFCQLAGVSNDPATLVSLADCTNACIPDGLKMAALIELFAQLAGVSVSPPTPPPQPCINLIPDGAQYGDQGFGGGYYFSGGGSYLVVLGQTYQITWGDNEFSIVLAGGVAILNTGTGTTFQFVAVPGCHLVSVGAQNHIPVTATLCLV